MNNRLFGSVVYLAGSMDECPENGAVWRTRITPKLQDMGIIVLNPLDKPTDIVTESMDDKFRRQKMINNGEYLQVAEEMRLIRRTDLRMTDLSHFGILYLDKTIPIMGSAEELFNLNRAKKPVLIMCKQGKHAINHWLWGCLPSQLFFGSWDDLLEYIKHINEDDEIHDLNRWQFFNYKKLMPNNLEKIINE